MKRNKYEIKPVKERREKFLKERNLEMRKSRKEDMLGLIKMIKEGVEKNLFVRGAFTDCVTKYGGTHIAIRFLCSKNKHLMLEERPHSITSRIIITIVER